MPAFVLTGFMERYYPASRDAHGVPLGTVSPGDVRDLDEPPDMWWTSAEPVSDEDRAREAMAAQPEPPQPDGPTPAPPAIIP